MDRRSPSKPQMLDTVSAILRAPDLAHSRIVALDAQESIVEAQNGRILRVIFAPSDVQSITNIVDHCLANNGSEGTELVFLGGDQSVQDAIARAVPALRMRTFFIHHLSDNGELRTWPAKKGHLLGDVLPGILPISHREEQELFAKKAFDQARAHDEQRERLFFFREVKQRRSPVTFGLLAAILLMFALQLRFSGDVLGALGVRAWDQQMEQYWLMLAIAMGALWTPSVLDGEWWRGISVGFLHFNLIHIAANSFVLYILGSQLERVLGSARFIIIYTVALLGGSLASTFLTDGVAVGASGAIWGLLGAQVALAYGRPPILPASVARAMKPMAMRNLVLNIGISFIGGIDWAAHFGGGIFGGLLLASGILYAKDAPAKAAAEPPPFLRLVAGGAVLLLVAGVAAALLVGQPWNLAEGLRAAVD